MQYLVPPEHQLVVLGQNLLQALIVVGLQILIILHAMGMDESLDLRIGVPKLAIDLVSANVEVSVGEELRHLVDELVEKFIRVLLGRIRYSIRPFGIDLKRAGAAGQFRISGKPGPAVAGCVELGNDPDTAIMSIGDEFADFALRVIEAFRSHLMQLGELLALDAETLIVGEMPVQDVHLYRGHAIDVALENVERGKVAADVNEQSAPGKAWLVFDGDGGHGKAGGARLD